MKKEFLAGTAALLLCSACSRVPGQLLVMQGNFHAARGRYTEAIAAYMNALAYPEAVPYGEYGLGAVYLAMNESDAALERFGASRQAALSLPDGELLYRIVYNTGIVHFEAGDYKAAAEAFKNALTYDSRRIEAKRNLELSLLSLLRNDAAGASAAGIDIVQENAGNDTLFEYIRRKEQELWKSRETSGEIPRAADY